MCRWLRCEDLIGYESSRMGREQDCNHKTVVSARGLGNFDPCNHARFKAVALRVSRLESSEGNRENAKQILSVGCITWGAAAPFRYRGTTQRPNCSAQNNCGSKGPP